MIKSPDAKGVAPYFQDWIAHPSYDDYWKQWAIDTDYSRINIPAFHVGAWYDIFLRHAEELHGVEKRRGESDFSRKNQRLLIEIGGHAGRGARSGTWILVRNRNTTKPD